MNKKPAFFSMILALALLLSSCGGKESGNTEPGSTGTESVLTEETADTQTQEGTTPSESETESESTPDGAPESTPESTPEGTLEGESESEAVQESQPIGESETPPESESLDLEDTEEETDTEGATEGDTEGATESYSDSESESDTEQEIESESASHEHETGWIGDGQGHYTGYVCGCENEQAPSYAAHKDADRNGACDVCQYVTCAHTYDTAYTSNKTDHWHPLTCGCWVTPDKQPHADTDRDGVCDECRYALCTHTYEAHYRYDETHHFLQNTCECELKADRLPHEAGETVIENYTDATTEKDGSYDKVSYCAVCGYELSRDQTVIPKKQAGDETYVVYERYMPEGLSASLKTLFESGEASFSTFSYGSCPYVIRDVYTLSSCQLLSISIPVSQTKALGSDGCFTFTITVGGNGWESMKQTPARVITVKVNAEAYGLVANKSGVNKWIKIDLTPYDIVLSDTQTIGFGKSGDTLIPAYLPSGDNSNEALALIKRDFGQMIGFLKSMGKNTTIEASAATLPFDFELLRVYESKDAYDAKLAEEEAYQKLLAAVKEAYAGKTLSILGDSISTYQGISNNKDYNATIGNNAVYYPTKNTALYDHTYTYWGRLLADLDMSLCVNNAWSNSRVLDSTNMPSRAGELDNRQDEAPDVIIFYMGINDLHQGSAYGDLYAILTDTADQRSDREKIKAWLDSVPSKSATFDQAYAAALKTMTEKYPDAEVFCITLNDNNDSRMTQEKLTTFNTVISALAEYFGAGVISQQEGYITKENCHAYTNDSNCLHPNSEGHALFEKLIVESLYANMSK